jgi:RNA polymerase sigma-70 factor (ECF subfamily)
LTEGILKRIAAGDRTAVQDCLDQYGGLIWSIARRMLRNSDDAEDAVQEIFVDIWKNAGKFDETQSSETTFVAMIARRRLIDRIRFANRRISPESLEDVTIQPEVRSDREMQICIEAKEAAAALKTLRPEQRQVIQLSIVQGMSQQEIAEATGMPLGTVKTHARRGLMMLREAIGLGDLKVKTEGTV